jgi:hypothetical protein
MQTRVKAVSGAVVAALVTFVPSFMLFDWILVAYWEWQHEGRPMKITLWADEPALLITLLLCAAVFYLAARYLQRRLPMQKQIKGWSLLIGAASSVVLIYFSVYAYVWVIVSRIFSDPNRLPASHH